MDTEVKNEYEKHDSNKKSSFIERMFDKLFFALSRDIKVTFLVIMVISNTFTLWKYVKSQEDRLSDNQIYSERIIEEIRRKLRMDINRDIDKKNKKIENKVDKTSNNIDELHKEIKKLIEKQFE
jgi:hypothetical protein